MLAQSPQLRAQYILPSKLSHFNVEIPPAHISAKFGLSWQGEFGLAFGAFVGFVFGGRVTRTGRVFGAFVVVTF